MEMKLRTEMLIITIYTIHYHFFAAIDLHNLSELFNKLDQERERPTE